MTTAIGMTVTEAAVQLGISPKTVRAQIRNGVIKAHKFAGVWVIETGEVGRYRLWNLRKDAP